MQLPRGASTGVGRAKRLYTLIWDGYKSNTWSSECWMLRGLRRTRLQACAMGACHSHQQPCIPTGLHTRQLPQLRSQRGSSHRIETFTRAGRTSLPTSAAVMSLGASPLLLSVVDPDGTFITRVAYVHTRVCAVWEGLKWQESWVAGFHAAYSCSGTPLNSQPLGTRSSMRCCEGVLAAEHPAEDTWRGTQEVMDNNNTQVIRMDSYRELIRSL